MEQRCKNFEKCPIYSGVLRDKQFTAESYRHRYCEAAATGWNQCKRFLVKERAGKCPPDLLPNSPRSVEEIVAEL